MRMSVLLIVIVAGSLFAQKIPNYCYKLEKIDPNLEVSNPVHVSGTILDPSRAPFVNSRVELRKYISQRKQLFVRVVSTDGDGHFDLGIVEPGKYRLLASQDRGYKQPPTLTCQTGDTCKLDITLDSNGTDLSIRGCPIR